MHVSSSGGPRVLLPTVDISRWIDELGESPTPDQGLYKLACSVERYCGVVSPWGVPLLIFGEEPADIFYLPGHYDGLFFRWIGSDSIEALSDFAIEAADSETWDEATAFNITDSNVTLMDTCTFHEDNAPRIQLKMRTGSYIIRSRYVEKSNVMTIVHRLEHVG